MVKLLVAGNGFALLAFGIGHLLIRGKRAVNYWSFAFFTYSAATFIYSAAINSGLYSYSPTLVWMDFPIVSLTGPLFFFYFSRLADPEYRFAWKEQWLFAPSALSLVATPIVLASRGEGFPSLADRASNVSILWLIFCCALFLARTAALAKDGRPGEATRSRFLMAIAGGMIVWAALFFVTELSGIGVAPLVLAATLFIMAVYFYHLRHPELLASGPMANPSPQHGRSKVAGLDLKATIDRLNLTMEEDRPYLEDDLSLPVLAARIGLSQHQLSEILNREMGTTFKAYINRYRVSEAERVLRELPGAAIIEVALECGFRSKSAFNDIFREETGMTPTEYRRRAGGVANGG